MITIQFSNIQDCHAIYERLCQQNHAIVGINIKRRKNKQLLIWCEDDQTSFQSTIQPLLANVFTDYIIDTYEKKWINSLLENKFLYSEAEEKSAIVSIACLIMDGEKPDLPKINQLPSRKRLIEDSMLTLLREGGRDLSFSFDSFIQFRLKEYRECLLTYVEMAIDEYKLEQDYQNLIDNLRAFVERKNPVIEKICVVYDKKPVFYDGDLLRIEDEVIRNSIKISNLFLGNTLIESSLLQPLLALAPQQIDLYTKTEESGILFTLQNIFQERLTVYSLDMFANLSHTGDSLSN